MSHKGKEDHGKKLKRRCGKSETETERLDFHSLFKVKTH
jgi:hypothetical protein